MTAKLHGEIDRVFEEVAREFGVTVIEAHILHFLFRRDGQMASELARQCGRAATSFTPNLDSLEKKGLIERKPHATDRRAVVITLTRKAKDLHEPFFLRFAEAADKADKLLSEWVGKYDL